MKKRLYVATVVLAASLSATIAVRASADPQLDRGRYLATVMNCGDCHTTGGLTGNPDPAKYLAGSDVGWFIPDFGVFYPPNLTSDEETGIGNWTEADIVKALKTGEIPGGRVLVTLMPWPAFSKLNDTDMEALAYFIKRLPPVSHAVPGPTALKDVKTPYFTLAMPPGPAIQAQTPAKKAAGNP